MKNYSMMKHIFISAISILWAASAVQAHHTPPTQPLFTQPMPSIDWSDLIDQSEAFGRNAAVLQLGYGFVRNHNLPFSENEGTIGPFSLLYEKSVYTNVSVGAFAAIQFWEVPQLEYRYNYLAVGVRSAYHFNVDPKWDPYLGLSISWRRGTVSDEGHSESNGKVGLQLVAGCRYYLTDKFGVYAELGNDMLSAINLGICLRFGND